MESLSFIVLWFMLNQINFVVSGIISIEDDPPCDHMIETGRADSSAKGTFIPTYGLYLIGFSIALLVIVVAGLIVYVWHLKHRRYSESIASDTKKVDSATYTRQLSAESHVLLTPLPKRHDNFSLSDEKITIVDCPNDNEERLKLELPHTKRAVLNKPVMPFITPAQINAIITGVLHNSKEQKEFSSLSNLDKIINEEQTNEKVLNVTDNLKIPNNGKIKRFSSTPVIDIIDDIPENTENVKMLVRNIDSKKSSFNSLQKKSFDDKLEKKNEHDSKARSGTDINEPDEIYGNPSNSIKNELIAEIKDKLSKKFERSSVDSSACLINNLNEDDVYDNPPSHARPISSNINGIEEDFYETGPSNRPLTLLEDQLLDNIYDNPKSEENTKLLFSELKKDTNLRDSTSHDKDGEIYEKPRETNREITFTNADNTDYLMALTKNTENCLEARYINARELKTPAC